MTFNLDAVVSESEATPFEFTFGGEEYVLPAKVSLVVGSKLDAGDLEGGMSELLGEDQWDRLFHSPAVFDLTALKALMEAYGEHLGVSLGESPASTGSSKSTAGPSKRTSKGTTGSRSQTLSKVG